MFGASASAALDEVGPIDTSNGFPVSYTDGANPALTLGQCLDPSNCTFLVSDLPNPSQPLSFPGNFVDEIFWWTGETAMSFISPQVGGGTGSALLIMALEGAFFGGPVLDTDQVSFSRIRLKILGLLPNSEYQVTHPYGVLNLLSDAEGTILYVDDCGMGLPGDSAGFRGVRDCPIGPFLVWDETLSVEDPDVPGSFIYSPPAGFIGDAAIEHQVIGSPFNTNYFFIYGPGLGPAGLYKDRFIVTGKKAPAPVATDVRVDQAIYSIDATRSQIEVFVTATPTSLLVISNANGGDYPLTGPLYMEQLVTANPDGTPNPTGTFFINADIAPYEGTISPIVVTDLTQSPPLKARVVKLRDRVTITEASYDSDTSTLTVKAASSDADGTRLVVTGFAPPNEIDPLTGTFSTILLGGPPHEVTVQSVTGTGTATSMVTLVGSGSTTMAPAFALPFAHAGPDQTVYFNTRVTLDGSASTGVITNYQWEQVDPLTGTVVANGVDLSNKTNPQANFIFPDNPSGPLTFQLTLNGPGGKTTDTVVVSPVATPPVVPTVARAQFKVGKGEWRIDGTTDVFLVGATIDKLIVYDPFNLGVTQQINSSPIVIDAAAGAGMWAFSAKGINLGITAVTLRVIAISSSGDQSAPVPLRLR